MPTTLWDVTILPAGASLALQDGTNALPPLGFWEVGWAAGKTLGVHDPGKYAPLATEVVVPAGASVTVRIGANFSRVKGFAHFNEPISILLSSSSRVELITPDTQPYVANFVLGGPPVPGLPVGPYGPVLPDHGPIAAEISNHVGGVLDKPTGGSAALQLLASAQGTSHGGHVFGDGNTRAMPTPAEEA